MGKIIKGDAFELLPAFEKGSIDAIVTDPPYDLPKKQIDWLMVEFRRVTDGHILVFCKPENLWAANSYLFWVKPTSTKNFSKSHGRFVEMIAHAQKGKTFNPLFWANMTGVYTDVLEGIRQHPSQKPLSLIRRLVLIHTNPGDVVLDPFTGSGTTAVACKETNRNFIGIEIDSSWIKLANERL